MGTGREDRGSSNPIEGSLVAHDEIAIRAYELYLQRGAEDGYDMDDWLRAEQEIARERAEQVSRPELSKSEAA